MPNRLTASTSPYLLQHADNPVDWWEWSPEAFAEARRRNVPILLSVGYAACHWCHVMAHESFEDEQVAADLAAGFVAIKVDREERPDVDAVYMRATTAMTGHGGWPMTTLLTPDADPFWCGTYLPREQFRTLLANAGQAWAEQEQEIRASGARIRAALDEDDPEAVAGVEATGRLLAQDGGAAALVPLLEPAVSALAREYDAEHGGFGGAPKFPPSMVLAFLLRRGADLPDTSGPGARAMAAGTLRALVRSGTYDQLEGGFARYAVDAGWVVPHFEKMLYDNALLLQALTEWWAVADTDADRDLAERAVRETVAFLLTRLRTPEGGFASSLDADTDGVEGATYVWTPEQVREVLGTEDGDRAVSLLGVTAAGTFEHGASTLQLPHDPAGPDGAAWWAAAREGLAAARAERPQPARDDKVVTAWNGLVIAALAQAGQRFAEPDWIEAAARAARLVLEVHVVDGRLRRASRDGVAGPAGAVSEDLGDLAVGLLALHAATADPHWLAAAIERVDEALEHYPADPARTRGLAFHDNAADIADADDLPIRPASRGDNAEPCGQSALALALLRLGAAVGSAEYLAHGRAALAPMAGLMARAPRFAGWALTAAAEAVAGPVQVALAIVPGDAGAGVAVGEEIPTRVGAGEHPLLAASRRVPPGTTVLAGVGDSPGVPLLAGRGPVDGRHAAYVCRGTVCDLPITDADTLTAALNP